MGNNTQVYLSPAEVLCERHGEEKGHHKFDKLLQIRRKELGSDSWETQKLNRLEKLDRCIRTILEAHFPNWSAHELLYVAEYYAATIEENDDEQARQLAFESEKECEIIVRKNREKAAHDNWVKRCAEEEQKKVEKAEKEAKAAKEKEAEIAQRQEEAQQFRIQLFSRYFYADDVKSGKVPFDGYKMSDCLAFREIVADVRELVLADYFPFRIVWKLSDQQPIIILLYTLAKAMEFEDSGKLYFANAWGKDGHFDLHYFKEGELNREQLKLEAEKARKTNQGKTIPEQFARKQFNCFCKGIPLPTYCEIQGKQIEWIASIKKIATAWDEEESEETEHLIQWGEDQYKRQDFFAAAYPGQYNRVKWRVNFLGVYENDVLRLTTSQRTKLMYNILAYKYRDCLVPVDKADENTLKVLCDEERNNPTASDLLSRLRWTDGLSKLVTFGVGMKAGGAAKYTWCYTVDFSGNSAKYHGADMTWEIWGSNLTFILDNYNELLPPKKSEDLETVFRRTLYF